MKTTVILFFTVLTIESNAQRIPFFEESRLEQIFVDDENVAEKKLLDIEKENYRLPETMYPETYSIILQPTFEENFTFYGKVEIEAKVAVRTNEIVLHCKYLSLHEYHVYNDGEEFKIENTTYDTVTDKFSIVLETYLLPKMDIRITFKYEGLLKKDLQGFYRSSFSDTEGNRRYLATTQFQPTYARHAFPCFDEPALKARFNLSIIRPKNYLALTNMPKYLSEEVTDNLVMDAFEQTPKMSTYLVAIVVSEFEMLSTDTSNVRIWAKKQSIHSGHYALQFGTKIFDHFENLFNQTNPVPKTDMIAIPDFVAGAMENWGLITYREHLLLHDDIEGPDNVQQSIASIIAHECAHMWFGNLLTPKWWDFTWLSEGLASYFQDIGTAIIEPTWKMDQQQLVDTVHLALFWDSYRSSSPVSQRVYSEWEIENMFSVMTYQKGGSIIRMIDMSFGSEIFLGALRDYIAKNKYDTVESDDLWEALQNQVNRHQFDLNTSVKDLMHNWINEPGHPVLFVNITRNTIILSQKRFLVDPDVASRDSNITWHIPITFTSWRNPDFNSIITTMWINETTEIGFENATDNWILFNHLGAGFYRVNYDTRSWYRIIAKLKSDTFEEIHELNRANIINDMIYLARAELLDSEIVVDALQYLTQESNYLPFKVALNGLRSLMYTLDIEHILNLIEKPYKKIGFLDGKNDDRFTILLRQELNSAACKLGHQECIDMAKKIFANWRQNSTEKVPKNQRPVVYCYALKEGSNEDWEFLKSQYSKTEDVYERLVILKALGCSRHNKLLDKYLLSVITDTDEEYRIHMQDRLIPFKNVASSVKNGTKYILDFLAKHKSKMVKYFGSERKIVKLFTMAINDHSAQEQTAQDYIDSLQQYINEHADTFSSIKSSLQMIIKSATRDLEWRNKHSDQQNDIKYEISWIQRDELHRKFKRMQLFHLDA